MSGRAMSKATREEEGLSVEEGLSSGGGGSTWCDSDGGGGGGLSITYRIALVAIQSVSNSGLNVPGLALHSLYTVSRHV